MSHFGCFSGMLGTGDKQVLIERAPTLADGDPRPKGSPVMLPPAQDAVATAAWIQAALSGEQPVPENLARQVALILAALDEPHDAPHAGPHDSPARAEARQPDRSASASPPASPQ